jgi:GH25 family lysozyme M1 (1,4-beta-N-acetylmuramidase)
MACLRYVFVMVVIFFGAFAEHTAAQPYLPGIDVSNYQGNVNWSSVKNAGIKFAFTRRPRGSISSMPSSHRT